MMIVSRCILDLGDFRVHELTGGDPHGCTSYALQSRGRAALVGCHDGTISAWWKAHALPRPDVVWHTHVQTEHCREGEAFGDVPSRVPAGSEELAADREAFVRDTSTTWSDPADWSNSLGRERYGIAGATTCRPPDRPLRVTGVMKDGDVIDWAGVQLNVLALPGHMAEAVGLILVRDGQPKACFIGDLMCAADHLVNLYDLESAYGRTRLESLPAVLRALADRAETDLFLPSTGPPITDGRAAARRLADRIERYHAALSWRPPGAAGAAVAPLRTLGRFHEVVQGVYQLAPPGNAIVLIDAQGRGLMIDPGPCDFENERRAADFMADVAQLECRAGLRTIDRVLITHMHGDHYDLAPQIVERYGGCRVAAWAPVADVIESPENYPYACLMPWYGLDWPGLRIDDRLTRRSAYHWHDATVTTVHLPGHCLLHAGYLICFRGRLLAVTGDTVQTHGQTMTVEFIMCNHSAPTRELGLPGALHALAAHPVDLNLGGHGSRFANAGAMYAASLKRVDHALPLLQALVPHGDLAAACVRPNYPDARRLIDDAESAAHDTSK